MDEPRTLREVLPWILRHPGQTLWSRWNYKSALLSSLIRACLFFSVNASAGSDAALAAMTTELWFRFSTAGFYGALTQAFRRVEPQRHAVLGALVIVPAISHGLELLVHWWRGTDLLAASVAASVVMTAFSTTFNVFAMRRGVLITGDEHRSFASDLCALPRLLVLFVAASARAGASAWR
jgi:hypothetical protein